MQYPCLDKSIPVRPSSWQWPVIIMGPISDQCLVCEIWAIPIEKGTQNDPCQNFLVNGIIIKLDQSINQCLFILSTKSNLLFFSVATQNLKKRYLWSNGKKNSVVIKSQYFLTRIFFDLSRPPHPF